MDATITNNDRVIIEVKRDEMFLGIPFPPLKKIKLENQK